MKPITDKSETPKAVVTGSTSPQITAAGVLFVYGKKDNK